MRSMKVVGQITLTEEALRVCLGGGGDLPRVCKKAQG